MSEHLDKPANAPRRYCVVCSEPLIEGKAFCPSCGAKAVPSSTLSAIDAYIQKRADVELANRLRDQNAVAREIGDKATDIVWQRLRQFRFYATIFGALVTAFVAFIGVNTYNGLLEKFDGVVTSAEQRAQKKVDAVRGSLDQLSKDVDTQTKRVADKGGEISQKLQTLDATATAFSKRLDAIVRSLETQVAQISKQADVVSVREAYPALGQPRPVLYNWKPWKGKAEKGTQEKWVNINIDPHSIDKFSQD